MKKKMLLLGASGFIGRNLAEHFALSNDFNVTGVCHTRELPAAWLAAHPIRIEQADLTRKEDVARVMAGMDIVIQAAATTSGFKEVVSSPIYHITDNVVMNSLVLRGAQEAGVEHLVAFGCTVLYPSQDTPVREEDFRGEEMHPKYFGPGWTKLYLEKMCEFYSRLGKMRLTVLRHSNIYGPYDKYDPDRSHVFGATVTKVMTTPNGGTVKVWGDGSDERDLLHVDDLVRFIDIAIRDQKEPFELLNVGLGESISVKGLVERMIRLSGKDLRMEFDLSQPQVGFKLCLNIDRVRQRFNWTPQVPLDEGIRLTLDWYRKNILPGAGK